MSRELHEAHTDELAAISLDAYTGRNQEWIRNMTDAERLDLLIEIAAELYSLETPKDERVMRAGWAMEPYIEAWAQREWEAQQ